MEHKISFWQSIRNSCARLIIVEPLDRGHEVWLKLNQQLPKAVAAKVNDQPRIEKFAQLVKRLSFLDYYALKVWLHHKHETLKHDWDNMEHFTGSIEKYFTSYIQICEEHLEVMK